MNRTFIIAEAGVNHNGSVVLAKKLVDTAIDAGCDAVKFQTFKAKNLVSRQAQKADYQKKSTDANESQFEMLEKLEFSYEYFKDLKSYCDRNNIMFLSSPFDIESIDFLAELGLSIFKIPSGEITNLPYLRRINFYKKKVILSTGMANVNEILDALKILCDCKVSVLHCTTEYPCPYDEVNLNVLHNLANITANLNNVETIGYSDHTQGIEIPIAAVACGAKIIEKHFTLNNNMEGPDHKASLAPDKLKKMVMSIRKIEQAMGDEVKQITESEQKNMMVVRKSIVAKRFIKKGEILSEENMTTKRPAMGLSPMLWDKVVGLQASRDYLEDENIEESVV